MSGKLFLRLVYYGSRLFSQQRGVGVFTAFLCFFDVPGKGGWNLGSAFVSVFTQVDAVSPKKGEFSISPEQKREGKEVESSTLLCVMDRQFGGAVNVR